MKLIRNTLPILMMIASVSAHADGLVTTPQPIRAPGVGLSANVISSVEHATFRMDDAIDDSFCSVFPVTADGYMITALHCLRNCLVATGRMQQANNTFIGLQELDLVKTPQAPGATCDNLSIPALGVKGSVQVVATGDALSLFDARFQNDFSGFYQELKAKGYDLKKHDFAVLKIQPQQGPLSCLKLSSDHRAAGSDLWSIGFPLPATAGVDPVLSASHGRIFSSPEQSQTFVSQPDEDGRNWVRSQYGAAGIYFSNAANTFGQSGGPVVASDGTVIGVTSGFAVPLGGDAHEMVTPTTETILNALPSAIASDLRSKNANCP